MSDDLPNTLARLIRAIESQTAAIERVELMLAKRLPRPTPVRKVGPNDAVPMREIVAAFVEICPHLDRPSILTNERRMDLRNIWRRFRNADGGPMEAMKGFFEAIRDSDFLSGRIPKSTWRADLWWAIQPDHMAGILEGRYSNEARNRNGHSTQRR